VPRTKILTIFHAVIDADGSYMVMDRQNGKHQCTFWVGGHSYSADRDTFEEAVRLAYSDWQNHVRQMESISGRG
jgi:hypothetical protein